VNKKLFVFAVVISLLLVVPAFQVFALEEPYQVTRLEFIRDVFGNVIANYEGNVTTFPDVSEEDANVVAASVYFRIANGYDDGLFRPHEVLTSEMAAAMTVKYLGLRDHALSLPDELLEGLDLPFWITPYFKWASTYHPELMPHFAIGEPASREFIEKLREIIDDTMTRRRQQA